MHDFLRGAEATELRTRREAVLSERIGVRLGIRDDPELHDVHADVGSELDGERPEPRLHGALRGEIRNVMLVRACRAGVAEGDHRPLGLGEVAGERMDEKQRRDAVHRHRALQVLAAQVIERRPRERPACEDDVVDAPALVGRRNRGAEPLDDLGDCVAMGQIRADELRRAPAAIERRRELFELVWVARREDHLVATIRDRLGDRDPEAARGAHDEDPPRGPSAPAIPVSRSVRLTGGLATVPNHPLRIPHFRAG